MPVALRKSAIEGTNDMVLMSQIVISQSTRAIHNVCVSPFSLVAHTDVMEQDDKNGGPNHLKAWRIWRGLSQAELAERVGTNANMIGYLEDGSRGLSLKWLRRLAPALDTNVGMLAQHDPNTIGEDLIELWATLSTRDQRKILEIAKLVISEGGRDGTSG